MLGKIFIRQHIELFFLYFLGNRIWHFMQIVSMKLSILSSGKKKKKNISKWCLLKSLLKVLRVKWNLFSCVESHNALCKVKKNKKQPISYQSENLDDMIGWTASKYFVQFPSYPQWLITHFQVSISVLDELLLGNLFSFLHKKIICGIFEKLSIFYHWNSRWSRFLKFLLCFLELVN